MSQGERSLSDLAQENCEGDAADGAAVGCRPAEGKAALARSPHAAADIQYVFGSQRSGWRTWRPSQQVRGFGFGFWQDLGPRREAPFFFFFVCLWRRGDFRWSQTVGNGGLSLSLYFLITRINGLTGGSSLNAAVERKEMK